MPVVSTQLQASVRSMDVASARRLVANAVALLGSRDASALWRRLASRGSSSSSSPPPAEDSAAVFSPLTPEEEQVLERVLKQQSKKEDDSDDDESQPVLAHAFHISIRWRNLGRLLTPCAFLDDEVVNFYTALLQARADEPAWRGPSVFVENTFFFTQLSGVSGGAYSYVRVEQWHAKRKASFWWLHIDIFALDLLLCPVHCDIHWVLGAIDFRRRRIDTFDSLATTGDDRGIGATLLRFLGDEHLATRGDGTFDPSGWVCGLASENPQQENWYDCGVFVCATATALAFGVPPRHTQAQMPFLRRRIAADILGQRCSACFPAVDGKQV